MKIDHINILRGKDSFTVKDLKKVLDKMNDHAEVRFGGINLETNHTIFKQEDNMIFRITFDDRESEWEEDYTLEILTEDGFI